jgi:hypothetical protein
MRNALSALVAVFCLGVGCTGPTEAYLPEDGEVTRYQPLPVYSSWWSELSAEAEILRPFPDLQWFAVEGGG